MAARKKFEPEKEESLRSQVDDQKFRALRVVEEESRT